jgi:DNA-binding GntR family transcriptional regulator
MSTWRIWSYESEFGGTKVLEMAEELRQKLLCGELQPGTQLPSRSEMADLGINHIALDWAQRALEQDELIAVTA